MKKNAFYVVLVSVCIFPGLQCADNVRMSDDFQEELVEDSQDRQPVGHIFKSAPSLDCSKAAAQVPLLTSGIINGFKLQNILQHNVYKYTHPLVVRPLQDLPSLQPLTDRAEGWSVYGTAFYNHMAQAYFTERSPFLKEYLAILANPSIDFTDSINVGAFAADIPAVINLFAPVKMQQHRMGLMLGFINKSGEWTLNAAIPLVYQAFHFHLTQQEKDTIQESGYFPDTGLVDTNQFLTQHLANDKFGLGDLRVRLDYRIKDSDSESAIRLGAEATFPTDKVLRSKIMAGDPSLCTPIPEVNWQTIVDLGEKVQFGTPLEKNIAESSLKTLLFDYTAAFFDRLSGALADVPLGQKHISVGPYVEILHPLASHTKLLLYGCFDYYFEHDEVRMFKQKKTSAEFNDRDYASTDEAVACANLRFLNQQTQNTFYPPVVTIVVKPRVVAKAAATLAFDFRVVQAAIGYDFWWQGKEHFGSVVCNRGNQRPLDFAQGQRQSAMQGKIFGRLCLQRYIGPNAVNWRTGLRVESTVNNRGIGKDWLVGVDLIFDF